MSARPSATAARTPHLRRMWGVVVIVALLLAGLMAGVAEASTNASCPDGDVPEDGMIDVPVSNVHEYSIDCLVWWRVTAGCNPDEGNTRYCPAEDVTRAQMASFLVRVYERVTGTAVKVTRDWFVDDGGNIHENNINKLREIGITFGCNPGDGNTRYCPNDDVTRGQMGSFLVRTYTTVTGNRVTPTRDWFADDNGNVHETNINRLRELAITKGCNPGGGNTRYCPDEDVTRAQMGSFLVRELGVFVKEGETNTPKASPDGQTNNDGDPCEVNDCPEVIIASAVANDDGDGHIGRGDRWVIRFSTEMETRTGFDGEYETIGERYEYRNTMTVCGDYWPCEWIDDKTLEIRSSLNWTDHTYPAEILHLDLESASGTPLDLKNSTDTTLD